MNSGIYRIDLGNGWFYIGSAVNLSRREAVHRSTLNHGKHSNIKVQRCWNKYRVFVFNVLEICEKSELISREQFYLDKYFNNNFLFVNNSNGNKDLTDLYLLTQCKYFIISPSTFSWWGAWLSKRKNKICVRPNNLNVSNNKDFWPKDWKSIL